MGCFLSKFIPALINFLIPGAVNKSVPYLHCSHLFPSVSLKHSLYLILLSSVYLIDKTIHCVGLILTSSPELLSKSIPWLLIMYFPYLPSNSFFILSSILFTLLIL